MCFYEDLWRSLTEIYDLALNSFPVFGICEGLEVDWVFVSEVEEYIESFYSLLASLLKAKYQVDPAINILTDDIHLKGLPELRNIEIGIVPGPLGQLHIMDPPLILHQSQIVFLLVEEHLWQREELRDKLADVRILTGAVFVGVLNWEEQAIGEVELAPLQADRAFSEWADSDQVVVDYAWARVVGTVMEFLVPAMQVQVVITLLESLDTGLGTQASHIFA